MESFQMSKHSKFILTPITEVIDAALSATKYLGNGLETIPISEYVIDSLFLKMTGFQEQKLKCIAWEMATNDFEYRRDFIRESPKLGEYSTYDSKKIICQKIIELIKKMDNSFDINNFNKKIIKEATINYMESSLNETNLSIWNQKEYNYFKDNIRNIIVLEQFLNPELFGKVKTKKNNIDNKLKLNYERMYNQRNKVAHNVTSYQQNLPSLNKLREENEESRNYFIWFAILVLIDNVFMELYKEYEKKLHNCWI